MIGPSGHSFSVRNRLALGAHLDIAPNLWAALLRREQSLIKRRFILWERL